MQHARTPSQPAPQSIANPSRLAALVNTGLLDTPIEESFDRLTKLAARTIHTPVSLVSLVDRERQFFKSAFGLPEPWLSMRETPLTHSFCKHVVTTCKPLLIEDATIIPLFKDSLAITALKVISYAGMPLILKNKQCIGSLCVIDHYPRKWTDAEIEILNEIAASVMAEIELRLIFEAKKELQEVISHDLKNALNVILINAQILRSQSKDHPLLSKISNQISNGSECMKNILQNISELDRFEQGEIKLDLQNWNIIDLLNRAWIKIGIIAFQAKLNITSSINPEKLLYCDGPRIAQSLANLLSVVIKRNPESKTIDVQLSESSDNLFIEIKDKGAPFIEEDISHFFDRFIKSSALVGKGAKLSVCLANEMVRAHGGNISIKGFDGTSNSIQVSLFNFRKPN